MNAVGCIVLVRQNANILRVSGVLFFGVYCCIGIAQPVAIPDIGDKRLFMTQAQREYIQRMKSTGSPPPGSISKMIEPDSLRSSETPEEKSSVSEVLFEKPESVQKAKAKINGFIVRPDGKSAVWINGERKEMTKDEPSLDARFVYQSAR